MDWVRGSNIGHGSFGTVSLAVPTNQNCPQLMAVKTCGVAHSASLMHEKLILDELSSCPEIISCFGDCFSFENGEKLYNVLLDYAAGGTLADKIKNSENHQLSEFEVKGYTKAILRGLEFIHKNGYVHCDIKLQNILLSQNDEVKVADFGLAKRVDLQRRCESRCELRGTPMSMSPEMVVGGEQGCPADIWALGCVMVELLTGAPVWSCSDMAALLMKIGVGEEVPEVPLYLSDEGKDFLGKCFVKDSRNRWTAEMLLDHDFLNNVDDTVTLKSSCDVQSISPRCPFDFPNWVSGQSSIITYSNVSSPSSKVEFGWCGGESWSMVAGRLKGLVCNQELDWSVGDDWVTVR